jgi:hypothetical protein
MTARFIASCFAEPVRSAATDVLIQLSRSVASAAWY